MPRRGKTDSELRLEATHSHLYPGLQGRLVGALPAAGAPRGKVCEVALADGSIVLGSLTLTSATEGVLETGPYATAAGTHIPKKRWRLELSPAENGQHAFRVRAKIAVD